MSTTLRTLLSFLGLLCLLLVQVGVSNIFSDTQYIGSETRDLFDHIALLDQWSWHTTSWNYPSGGALIPPDFYSMIFALPWWGLGRAVAYDMALLTQLICNAAAGWYLGRVTGGSPLVTATALLFAPFALGQLNSGETETIGLWGLCMCLATLSESKWKHAGVWGIITAIGSWYYGAYAALILTTYCSWKVLRTIQRPDTMVKAPLLAPLIMAIGLAIPAYLYANMLQNEQQMFRGPTMDVYLTEHPRALAAFSSHPLLWFDEVPLEATHIDALGWSFLLLGLWGLVQSWKMQSKWLILFIVSLAFSLGPRLHNGQQVIWEWMPYDLLMWIPPLDNMRLPHRWMAVASIVLSAWIGLGGRTFPILATLLLWGESTLFMPAIQHTEIPIPTITQAFQGPVLQLPTRTMTWDARGRYLVYQRSHQQPIPYSLLMQGWSKSIAEEPLVLAVTKMDSKDPISSRTVEARQFRQETFALEVVAWGGFTDTTLQENTRERLLAMGFSQVCLHRDLLDSADRTTIQQLLMDTLGEPSVQESEAWLWKL